MVNIYLAKGRDDPEQYFVACYDKEKRVFLYNGGGLDNIAESIKGMGFDILNFLHFTDSSRKRCGRFFKCRLNDVDDNDLNVLENLIFEP